MSELGAPPPRPSTARLSTPPMAALEEISRPRAIAVSFWCWLAGSLLVAAIVAVTSTRTDPMRTEFARLAGERDPDASRATVDQVASASVLVVLGTGVLLGILGLALAGAMRAGRGWARVVLTLAAVVGVAYTALVTSSLTHPMLEDLRTPVTAGLLAYTALTVVATVCMFLPGTMQWFRRPRGDY